MTVHLSPDIYVSPTGPQTSPPIDVRVMGEHVCLTPVVHNQREIIVALAKAMKDPQVRADLLLVRQHPLNSIERAHALDRLTDSLDVCDALTWCISTADADDLANRITGTHDEPDPEHVHHYVPRPAGAGSQRLVCDCGATPNG